VSKIKPHRLPKPAGSDARLPAGSDARLRDTEGIARLPYRDLAEALQARILADLKAGRAGHPPRDRPDPDECCGVGTREAHIAALAEAMATAEALGEQRREEAETAAKRVAALEAHIATLEEAVAKAEALGEQRRREAQTATKRADDLVAELVEMTSELVEMSKRMAEQTAATDKLRAELDDYRSRSLWWWWWQDSTG
jgi:DNA repair exonuclease SbcCD ATPase subunit